MISTQSIATLWVSLRTVKKTFHYLQKTLWFNSMMLCDWRGRDIIKGTPRADVLGHLYAHRVEHCSPAPSRSPAEPRGIPKCDFLTQEFQRGIKAASLVLAVNGDGIEGTVFRDVESLTVTLENKEATDPSRVRKEL